MDELSTFSVATCSLLSESSGEGLQPVDIASSLSLAKYNSSVCEIILHRGGNGEAVISGADHEFSHEIRCESASGFKERRA